MDKNDRIYIAGHRGMVGSAIVKSLKKKQYSCLITRSKSELDLRDSSAVENFFHSEKPDVVVLAAARVGGIQANINHPAEFLYENLAIQSNVIHQSHKNGVKRFCFLGSSCIYPKQCSQPMVTQELFSGPLEPTNEGYALAKLTGLKLVEFYRRQYGFDGISLIPCNLYGTNDSFDPIEAHVLSSLVRKFVDATENCEDAVTIWGTGSARREFMHVDDAAEATVFLMQQPDCPVTINVGCGDDISIKNLAELIARKTNFLGKFLWDKSKPDGMKRKCVDNSELTKLGFKSRISLEKGIERTIVEYKKLKKIEKSL